MKCIFIIFLLMIQAASGQKPENVLNRLSTRQVNFSLAPVQSLPFRSVKVVDLRFDTSKVGFIGKDPYRKIVTKTYFSADAAAVLNQAIASSISATNDELWVFVRHYWLQENTTSELANNKLDQSNNVDWVTTCKVTMECFLRSDSVFMPVLRIDSVFAKLQISGNHIDDMASEPLQYLLQSLLSFIPGKPRNTMTFAQINEFARRFYKYPRFNTDSRAKGIYMTFRDFLNNQPLQKEFIIDQNRKTDELYIVENGEKKILTDFWGFCDGAVCYMNTGLNFFELVRINNSYEIYGAKGLVQHTTIAGRSQTSDKSFLYKTLMGGPVVTRDRAKMEKRPFQVNMESGRLY